MDSKLEKNIGSLATKQVNAALCETILIDDTVVQQGGRPETEWNYVFRRGQNTRK